MNYLPNDCLAIIHTIAKGTVHVYARDLRVGDDITAQDVFNHIAALMVGTTIERIHFSPSLNTRK